MMQSKLAANRFISCLTHKRVTPLWLRSTSSTTSRTADPSIHAGEPEGDDAEQAVRHKLAQEKEERVPDSKNQPPPKPASIASSPKLESSEIQSPDPTKQQKRHYQQKQDLKDVSCAGVDGFPDNGGDDKRMSQEDENREYYKDHKPSPISEVEFADTRKPVTQATDGSLSNKSVGAAGGIITFTKEQSESAEETLMKSMRIWRESAMRGDPDAPHSRALRAALLARGDHDVARDLEMGIDY